MKEKLSFDEVNSLHSNYIDGKPLNCIFYDNLGNIINRGNVNPSYLLGSPYRVRLILHPYSSINDYIDTNDGLIKPSSWIFTNYKYLIVDYDTDRLPYRVVKKLIEWRIDIFGLIENGLAVKIEKV